MSAGLESPASLDVNDFLDGVWRRNPVFVQVLGMCPVLAVIEHRL